ncbi:MAG: DUF4062 domain-containing protein [Planctomycetota bacterium]
MVKRIFVSATSADLSLHRKAVADVLITKDYLPVTQEHFPPDSRGIQEILRSKIETCDAVICLIGFRYGQEPKDRDPNRPRRSYTQLEYEIAVELGKPVLLYWSNDETIAVSDESAEKQQLQREHIDRIVQADLPRWPFRGLDSLRTQVALTIDVATSGDVQQSLAVLLRVEILSPSRLTDPSQIEMILQPWQEHSGEIAKRFGGEILSESELSCLIQFQTAQDATNAALLLREKLDLHCWTEDRPQFSYGVHVGEVIRYRGIDTKQSLRVGNAIDVTRVLTGLASAGQILLSRKAFDMARQHLARKPKGATDASDLHWRAHGRYLVTDGSSETDITLDEAIEICEVDTNGDKEAHPAPKSNQWAVSADSIDQARMRGWRPSVGQPIPTRDNWVIEKKLGEGGFGEVWLARDSSTRSHRVFKFCFDADRLRSFKREVTLFKILKDALDGRPDIVRLLQVRLDAPPFYLESEFVDSGNLEEWAESQGGLGSIPLEERLRIVAEIAQAVAAAHSTQVIHRDLKPTNIFMAKDTMGKWHPMLADFGIGALSDQATLADHKITHATLMQSLLEGDSSITGTRMYRSQDADTNTPQSDVYSIGVILFQMLVGDFSQPVGPGYEGKITRSLQTESDQLESHKRHLLAVDVADAIHVDPNERIQTADEIVRRLTSLPERARSSLAEEQRLRTNARNRRLRRLLQVASVLLAFVTCVAGFAFLQWQLARDAVRDRDLALHEKDQALNAEKFALGKEKATSRRLRRLSSDVALRLAKTRDRNAIQAMERGDTPAALALLTECMTTWSENAIADPDLRRIGFDQTGLRVAGILNEMPELSNLILADGPILKAELSDDGSKLAVLCDGWNDRGPSLRVWDVLSGKPFTVSIPIEMSVTEHVTIRISPQGRLLAIASMTRSSNTLTIWDISSSSTLASIQETGGRILTMEFNKDESNLALVTSFQGTQMDLEAHGDSKTMPSGQIQVRNVDDLSVVGKTISIPGRGAVWSASISQEKWIVACARTFEEGMLTLWDLSDLSRIDLDWVDGLPVTLGGVVDQVINLIALNRPASNQDDAEGPSDRDDRTLPFANYVALNADGSRMAVHSSTNSLELFDLNREERIGYPVPSQPYVLDFGFGSHGHPLFSVEQRSVDVRDLVQAGNDVLIYDADQFMRSCDPIVTGGTVNSVSRVWDEAFGFQFAMAMNDATVVLHEFNESRSVACLGHSDGVTFAEFTGNGSLVTCGLDGCVRIWKPNKGPKTPIVVRRYDPYATDIEHTLVFDDNGQEREQHDSSGESALSSAHQQSLHNYLAVGSGLRQRSLRFDQSTNQLELVQTVSDSQSGNGDQPIRSWESRRELEIAFLSPEEDRIFAAAGTMGPTLYGNIDRFKTAVDMVGLPLLPCQIRFVTDDATNSDRHDDFPGWIVGTFCDWDRELSLVVTWSPNGSQIRRYRLADGSLLDTTELNYRVVDASYGGSVLGILYADASCQLWDVSGAAVEKRTDPFGRYQICRLSPEGKFLAVANDDGQVLGWELNETPTAAYEDRDAIIQGRYNGLYLSDMCFVNQRLVGLDNERTLRVWEQSDHGTFQLKRQRVFPGHAHAMAGCSARSLVAVSDDTGRVTLFGADSLELIIDKLPIEPLQHLWPTRLWFDTTGEHLHFIAESETGFWKLPKMKSTDVTRASERLQTLAARRVLDSGAMDYPQFRGDDWHMLNHYRLRDEHWQWKYETAKRHFDASRTDEAMTTINQAIAASPESPLRADLLFLRSSINETIGNKTEFQNDWLAASRLNPRTSDELIGFAVSLLVERPEAVIELAEAVETHAAKTPDDFSSQRVLSDALGLKARANAQLARWKDAAAIFERHEIAPVVKRLEAISPQAALATKVLGTLIHYGAGNTENVQIRCRAIASWSDRDIQPAIARAITKSCGLLSPDGVDWPNVERTLSELVSPTSDGMVCLLICRLRSGQTISLEDFDAADDASQEPGPPRMYDRSVVEALEARTRHISTSMRRPFENPWAPFTFLPLSRQVTLGHYWLENQSIS